MTFAPPPGLNGENGDSRGVEQTVDEAVRGYIDAIPPEHRPLFDRLQKLILGLYPEATVVISYKIPTYRVEKGRLHIGTWKHGVSLYGWKQDGAEAFIARHPGLRTSKGTIQLRPEDAAALSDAELGELVHSALGAR